MSFAFCRVSSVSNIGGLPVHIKSKKNTFFEGPLHDTGTKFHGHLVDALIVLSSDLRFMTTTRFP